MKKTTPSPHMPHCEVIHWESTPPVCLRVSPVLLVVASMGVGMNGPLPVTHALLTFIESRAQHDAAIAEHQRLCAPISADFSEVENRLKVLGMQSFIVTGEAADQVKARTFSGFKGHMIVIDPDTLP